MTYVIHTSLLAGSDPVILGMYRDEAEARQFVENYVAMHGERDCLQIARVID